MAEKTTKPKGSGLGWLLVLIILLPLGYFGVHTLRGDIAAQGGGGGGVTLELKTELIEEVRSAQTRTAEEIGALKEAVTAGAGGGLSSEAVTALTQRLENLDADQLTTETQKIAETLAVLRQAVETIRADQRALNERLSDGAAAQAAPMIAPGTRPDTLNKTIFFPLAVSKGPQIDGQLMALLPEIKDYANGRSCKANVFGFSDTLGNDTSNLNLSKLRADYIADRLKSEGIVIGQVKGWGERWLDEFTKDGEKNDRNRRVVIEVDCTGIAETPAAEPAQAPEAAPAPSSAPAS